MKKSIITIIILLTFLFFYFLQVNFFSWFNIAGVKPNLFIILTLVIGLFSGRGRGVTFGIIMGLCLDFFIGKNFLPELTCYLLKIQYLIRNKA